MKDPKNLFNTDPLVREIYSKDASIFQIIPMSVALPETVSELKQIVTSASTHNWSVTPRGAATGITGGCLGEGVIIDTSKYLTRILEIDPKNETATVEPGVVLDDLNQKLAPFNLKFAPETSTGNRATIGGMAGNNAAGARSLRYGKMVDHVIECDLILEDGSLITFKELKQEELQEKLKLKTREGDIYRFCNDAKHSHAQLIKNSFPKLERRVSGYNLDELLKPQMNLAKVIVGSEGSFGVISRLKLNLVKKPSYTGLVIVHFQDILELMKAIEPMLYWNPLALEMLDDHIIHLGSSLDRMREKLFWLKGDPKGVIIAEFEGDSTQEIKLKISTFEADMRHRQIGYAFTEVVDQKGIDAVWEVRKAGLGLLMSKRSYTNACAFLEDMSIPPPRLAEFMELFLEYLKKENKEAGIYGHVGSGCMHIRPYLNLKDPNDLKLISRMMGDITHLLLQFGGVLSGEHGDGIIRSGYNEDLFGKELFEIFKGLKHAFDPKNLMNPGKVVGGLKFEFLHDKLKLSPTTPTLHFDTFYDFEKEGGFNLAVDMCNGNGQCRKKEGVMCPSFQATMDEYDDTRARANALQALIHKRLPSQDLANPEVKKILDLCISCKGCKAECPSQVDMAKMKSEFLYHYFKKFGIPFRSNLIARLPLFNQWAIPSLFNKLTKKPFAKKILEKIGFTTRRNLPELAEKRFSSLYKNFPQPKGQPIVLFNDTYTEFNEPEIGLSALKILNRLGYEVIVPPFECCGRPAFSKGVLEYGKSLAEKVIKTLSPYAHLPILVLEPSCFSALIDEYKDLKLDLPPFNILLFDQFIQDKVHKLPFKSERRKVKVHGHCHQKSLIGMTSTLNALYNAQVFDVEEIKSGCCGMAGSFGYEKEHYDFSMRIGELKLLPAIRQENHYTLLNANGISCRTQIHDGTHRESLHIAELLAQMMED